VRARKGSCSFENISVQPGGRGGGVPRDPGRVSNHHIKKPRGKESALIGGLPLERKGTCRGTDLTPYARKGGSVGSATYSAAEIHPFQPGVKPSRSVSFYIKKAIPAWKKKRILPPLEGSRRPTQGEEAEIVA